MGMANVIMCPLKEIFSGNVDITIRVHERVQIGGYIYLLETVDMAKFYVVSG